MTAQFGIGETMLRILILFLFSASLATAGPWPRGEKSSFLSYTFSSLDTAERVRHLDYNSVYAEYGITADYTLGLDVGFSRRRLQKLHGFVRFPPISLPLDWKFAVDVGLGISEHQRLTFRSNLIFGRAFSQNGVSGWITTEMRTYENIFPYQSWLEGETTVGVNITDRLKTMIQWQDSFDRENKYAARLAPSLVWEFAPGQHLEAGFTFGMINATGRRVRIGMWHQF